jgi:4,5-dihydroxyphthalate decarboxylase
MTLALRLGLIDNPRTRPIIEGKVTAKDIDVTVATGDPGEIFGRQLRDDEFDVSEMSMSTLMMMIARGDDRFIGLPIFTTRRFFHTHIMVRRDAKIETPADLKGKRVGVREFQQTAALWIRGALHSEFGVSPADMEFWMERMPEHSHGGAIGFTSPPGVVIHQIPKETNIGDMMIAGTLDACLFYFPNRNSINRSIANLEDHPEIKPLFPDSVAEGIRYYRKTGIYPINHGVVIKRNVAERHPWAIARLLEVFNEANAAADRARMEHIAYHLETGLLPPEYRKSLSTPLVSYGIEANRKTLEMAARYSHDQGLTSRIVGIDEIFDPNCLGS